MNTDRVLYGLWRAYLFFAVIGWFIAISTWDNSPDSFKIVSSSATLIAVVYLIIWVVDLILSGIDNLSRR